LTDTLKHEIIEEARRLGFILAGVTSPVPPPHLEIFEGWLAEGRHGTMDYMADESARARRRDPHLVMPECKSILALAIPYSPPSRAASKPDQGRVAAYAWGDDYHLILPARMKELVQFIEARAGRAVQNRWYTDTGPLLERELAQRAGLGWIGKNTCLIHPERGSYFLLAEILLDLELEPDLPIVTDHCGTCTRCLEACPTQCILPDRTLDARRCISYLTIELKDSIPLDLRALVGDWVFGCDVCQAVCPWNRFAGASGEAAFDAREGVPLPVLSRELSLSPDEFNNKFRGSPVKRAKRRGYLRNAAVALGNNGTPADLPALERALEDAEPLVREHASWAIRQIERRAGENAGE
jgi:epoxyqueuosine reductase